MACAWRFRSHGGTRVLFIQVTDYSGLLLKPMVTWGSSIFLDPYIYHEAWKMSTETRDLPSGELYKRAAWLILLQTYANNRRLWSGDCFKQIRNSTCCNVSDFEHLWTPKQLNPRKKHFDWYWSPHPGCAPRKIPMMWSLFPEKSPGKSLEICMEFPMKSLNIPESVPDCPAKNLPDPSAAHWVAFQGWAPGYTTCRVNFGWGWGFALRLWKKNMKNHHCS